MFTCTFNSVGGIILWTVQCDIARLLHSHMIKSTIYHCNSFDYISLSIILVLHVLALIEAIIRHQLKYTDEKFVIICVYTGYLFHGCLSSGPLPKVHYTEVCEV